MDIKRQRVNKAVGAMISAGRQAKGMTFYAMYKNMNKGAGAYLRDIEQGKRSLRADTLNEICEQLDITITFPIKD